ncbi:acyl-CoA dehydrogenase [Nocardioides sp. zg-536]|uniref:Acyl-CoA dehydrogenase n=1 Tax=Nocardioides faecalis TaxID=2803858 RepID=A0A939BWQ1_9ACTN|nr:acyl-CoA dehydrogenase [Nocardioides faecalis]MBM9460872.1 acyl-CoA dehydrogenase [Nocardioides faecalis]QVI59299.1 acyl-CoA dehydrogenase [Nocardioides faecalis]
MTLAITDEHRELARTAADLLDRRGALAEARDLLEADAEQLPSWWKEVADLGFLGLHVAEEAGGAGGTLADLVVLVEQLGRVLAPGPFVPTVVASAFLDRAEGAEADELRTVLLPGLLDGSLVAGVGIAAPDGLSVDGGAEGTVSGDAGPVLGGGLADVLLLPVGDDVLVLRISERGTGGPGVEVTVPANLDPTRRSARVRLVDVPLGEQARLVPGGAALLVDLARTVLAAEALGVAGAVTDAAASYAKQREQFGRVIGMFQAVKHHCADMVSLTQLATAAVWDAARATDVPAERGFAAATAAVLAADAAQRCTSLNTQVHGGIAITWEHDAHLYVRRAGALAVQLRPDAAAAELAGLSAAGLTRQGKVELPASAEPIREEVRAFAAGLADLDDAGRLEALIRTGYVVPHWPAPFGRDAGAIEQLVVAEELAAAGIKRPDYSITGWVLLTLIQKGTPEQVERWVPPALRQEVVWCQLFSEPGAGSDAAAVRTRGVRTAEGWVVNGQKVWTTGAHKARYGLATVRTDPEATKHAGITTMVIDMQAPGVTVRPLRQANGGADFNEVFFDDVLVPHADVVGEVHDGWNVARATLGNESVSIGGGIDSLAMPAALLVDLHRKHPERLVGGETRLGRYVALAQGLRQLNVRSTFRAVAGGEPGPEGAITKLMLSELGHEAAAILTEVTGPDGAFLTDDGLIGGTMLLMHRALAIAGGTSEIKRNQIGERILGLPRDPLVR